MALFAYTAHNIVARTGRNVVVGTFATRRSPAENGEADHERAKQRNEFLHNNGVSFHSGSSQMPIVAHLC